MGIGTRSPAGEGGAGLPRSSFSENQATIVNKKNPTRIGTWNVRTLLSSGRLEKLKQQMREKQLDVLGVCETKWGDNDDFWSDDFRIIHSGGKQGKNGVALLLNKSYEICVENSYHINDRILIIRIKSAPVNSTIIQVYFPTSNSDEEEIEQMYNILEEHIENIQHNDNLIIMGDFNAVVGNVVDSDAVRKYGLGTRNERGSRLVDFCKQNSFVITNTFFEVPLRRRYTWTAPGDTARYQLDYILVKSRYKNQVKYSHSFFGAEIDSDHKLVMMNCRVTFKKYKNRSKYKTWDLNKLKTEETRISYACELNRITKERDTRSTWDDVKENIMKTAENSIGYLKLAPRKPWITNEIMELIKQRNIFRKKDETMYRITKNRIT